jgi:hypothetical protein
MVVKRISHITPLRKTSISLVDVGVDQLRCRVLRARLEDNLVQRFDRLGHVGRVERESQTWQSLHHTLHFTWRPFRIEGHRIENVSKIVRLDPDYRRSTLAARVEVLWRRPGLRRRRRGCTTT